MAKEKIKIGDPYTRGNTLCVPVRFNFPDGTYEEETINWNKNIDADDVERQLRGIYQAKWKGKKDDMGAKLKKLKGKKILQVTHFDDEPMLPDDPA